MADENIRDILWTRNLCLLCISNLLLSISLYMLLPILPIWILQCNSTASRLTIGCAIALPTFSSIILGPFYAYLIDTYKRKYISITALLVISAATLLIPLTDIYVNLLVLRILQGLMFGLAIMTIGSTLVIDIAQSSRRTDANNAFAWFGRFGLSLGPLVGIILNSFAGIEVIAYISAGICFLALILVGMIQVPFRAPLNPPVCSVDRFFLLRGWPVAFNILLTALVLGILLATVHDYKCYVFLMVGFAISLVLDMHLLTPKRMEIQVPVGLILIGAGAILVWSSINDIDSAWLLPYGSVSIGCGIGLSAYCFLLFLIRLSEHCQRGTANSTYYLAWEIGIGCGLLAGYCFSLSITYFIGGVSIGLALLYYLFFVKYWFKKHRRR